MKLDKGGLNMKLFLHIEGTQEQIQEAVARATVLINAGVSEFSITFNETTESDQIISDRQLDRFNNQQ